MKIEIGQVFRTENIELEVSDIRYISPMVYHVSLKILNRGFVNSWIGDCTVEEMQCALDDGRLVFLQGYAYREENEYES